VSQQHRPRLNRPTVLVVSAVLAGCAVVGPPTTPSPPDPHFGVLVDIGIFAGPPELPPSYHIVAFTEESLLVVVDREFSQQLREVRWNGVRWEAVAGIDERLIPAQEKGPYLREVNIGAEDGFSTGATLLVGRVPNGAIARLEFEVDGGVEDLLIPQRPVFVTVYPAGTELGDDFQAFDLGTYHLEDGPIHQ
jgi:hypothetical protein